METAKCQQRDSSGASASPTQTARDAGGAPVLLIGASGAEYRVGPLRFSDLMLIEEELTAIPVRRAKKMIREFGDALSDEKRSEMISAAIAESDKISAQLVNSLEETLSQLQGLSGCLIILRVLVRRHLEPGWTDAQLDERVDTIISDVSIDEVRRALEQSTATVNRLGKG